MSNPHRYLSTTDIARILNIKPTSITKYKLPAPDAYIGKTRGWCQSTIDTWLHQRPTRGQRTDLTTAAAAGTDTQKPATGTPVAGINLSDNV